MATRIVCLKFVKIWILSLLLQVVSFQHLNSSLLYSQYGEPPLSPKNLKKPFELGETVIYRVHYGWFTAGEARFEVSPRIRYYQGRPCFLLRGEGKSASSFEWFYKLHDTFDSFVDTAAFLPHHYIRHSRQGSWRFSDTVYYDYFQSIIRGVKGHFKMLPNTQDMLSAVYYARCLDLRSAPKGQIFPISIFLDDGIYQVGVKILGKEVISTKLGKVRCIKVAPLLIAGRVFKAQEEMVAWLTDDANLLPIKIESAVIIGSVSADLKEYRNLKHPITAIIKT